MVSKRGILWRLLARSKALMEGLLTLLAPESGQQLYALKQFGAAHLKIEEPNPACGEMDLANFRYEVPHQPCLLYFWPVPTIAVIRLVPRQGVSLPRL